MTLPKGYKKPTAGTRPTARRQVNKQKLIVGIITFIFFVIGVIITYYNFVNYVETGKELEHEKQVLETMKRDLGPTF